MAKKNVVNKQKVQMQARGTNYQEYRPDEKETAYEKYIKAKYEQKKDVGTFRSEQPKSAYEKYTDALKRNVPEEKTSAGMRYGAQNTYNQADADAFKKNLYQFEQDRARKIDKNRAKSEELHRTHDINKLDAKSRDALETLYRGKNGTYEENGKPVTYIDESSLGGAAARDYYKATGLNYVGYNKKALKKQFMEDNNATEHDFKLYMQYLKEQHDAEDNAKAEEVARRLAKETPAIGSVYDPAEFAMSGLAGAAAFAETVKHNFDADPYSNVNTNSKLYRAQNFNQAYKQQQMQDMANALGNDTAANIAYGAYTSIGEMIPAIYMGGAAGEAAGMLGATAKTANTIGKVASLPTFGTSAFSSTLKEAQDRGLSKDQAVATATVAGLSEMGTEMFSLDNIFDIMKGSGKAAARSKLVNIMASTFIEGSEEATNDVINEVADRIINKDQSVYETRLRELLNNGYSEDDAKRIARNMFLGEVFQDFAAGAISGGVMGGGAIAARSRLYGNIAKQVNEGDYQAVVENLPLNEDAYENKTGIAAANEAVDMAQEYMKKTEEGQEVTQRERKQLVERVNEALENRLIENTAEKPAETTDNAAQPAEEKTSRSQNDIMTDMSRSKNARELTAAYHEAVETIPAENRGTIDALFNLKANALNMTGYQMNAARMTDEEVYNAGYNNKSIDYLTPKQAEIYREGGIKRFEDDAKTTAEVSNRAYNSEGKEYSIKGIKDVTTDNMTLQTAEGEVKLSDVKFNNPGEQRLYNNAAALNNTVLAQAYVDNYVPGMPVNAYDAEVKKVITAGQIGTSFEKAVSGPFAKQIGAEALKPFYDSARREDKQQSKNEKKTTTAIKKEGKVIDARTDKKSSTLNQGLLRQVADKFGVEIEITDSIAADKNGTFAPALGRIILNTNNPDMYKTMFHELSEFAQAYNEEGMDEVRVAVMEYALEKNPEGLRSDLEAYQKAYAEVEGSKSISEASEELFNDCLSEIFRDEEGTKDFVNWVLDNHTKSKAEMIIDRIAKFIKDIAEYINKNRRVNRTQATVMQIDTERAMEIRNQLLQAFDEAIKNRDALVDQEGEAGVRNSLEVNSEGQELSEGQKKFFANTKIVDEQGRLKVMYHGTSDAGFTVFDPGMSDDGISLFFTDDTTIARSYSGTSDRVIVNYTLADLRDMVSHSASSGRTTIEKDGKTYKVVNTYLGNSEVEMEGTYEEVKDYVLEMYSGGTQSGNYAVYLNAMNPMIIDAKGNNWDQLAPLEPYDRHLEKAEMWYDPDRKTTVIEYTENGEKKQETTKDYGDVDSLYKHFGLDIDEETRMFSDGYVNLHDLYFDKKGKRVEGYGRTRDYTKYAKEHGYDSVIFNDIIDYGLYDRDFTPHQVVVVFESNQVKSVDNLTPSMNEDIRYSIDVPADRVFYVGKTEVVQNPTSREYEQMREDILKIYPWLRGTDEPLLRHTYDEQGNEYYWEAAGGLHSQIEPAINKKYSTRTSQQYRWWESKNKDDYPADYSKRYSINVDSDGRDLSVKQQEYFKDSKVVDNQGRLMVMFHGSPVRDLTVFKNALNFFTPDRAYAERYAKQDGAEGEVYEVYLNIEKPFDVTVPECRRIFIDEYVKGGYSYSINPSLSDAEIEQRIEDGIDWTEADNLVEFIEEMEYDYDGLVLDEGGDQVLDENGNMQPVKRARSYVTFQSNQAKRTDSLNPTKDKDIRFSLDVPMEDSKSLIAIHNLHSSDMMDTLKLGGFPMPSIAIIKPEMGHDKYGNVSVLFYKDTINPKADKANKVYSGDAYTPEFPKLGYKVDVDKIIEIRKRMEELMGDKYDAFGYLGLDTDNVTDYLERNRGNVVDAFSNEEPYKYAFTQDKGIKFDLPMKESRLSIHYDNETVKYIALMFTPEQALRSFQNSKETYEQFKNDGRLDKVIEKINAVEKRSYGKLYEKLKTTELSYSEFDQLLNAINKYHRDGVKQEVDRLAFSTAINDVINQNRAEYEQWLRDLFDGVILETGIRNQRDLFTPSGNRRNWNSLYDPYNLVNLVRAMKAEPEQGKGFGGYSIFGSANRQFESIEDIHSEEGRLQQVDEDEYSKMKDDIQNDLYEIARRLVPNVGYDAYSIVSDIAEAAATRKTKSGIKNFLSQWYDVTDEDMNEIMDIIRRAAELPTGYFEAKPRRAVGFDEIASVIVPDLETDLQKALEEKNIPYKTYKAGDKESRKAAVNSVAELPDVRFSLDVDKYLKLTGEKGKKVKYHDLISEQQRYQLQDKFNDFMNGEEYSLSKDGCVIIPLSDVNSGSHIDNIAFVNPDGNLDRVYTIDGLPGTNIDELVDVITWREKVGYDYSRTKRLVESLFTGATLRRFSTGFLRSNKEFDRRGKGETFRANDKVDKTIQDGIGSQTGREGSRTDVRNSLDIDSDFGLYDMDDLQGVFTDEEGNEIPVGNSIMQADATMRNLARFLQAANEPLKGHKVNNQALENIAEDLKRKYSSGADTKIVVENLKTLFNYLQTEDEVNYDEVTRLLSEVSRPIIAEAGNVNSEMMAQYNNFVEYIKSQNIALSDAQKKVFDITPYGSWNNFRKAMFGTIKFNNDGQPIDTIWNDIAFMSGGFLDPDTAEEDMGIALADALTEMKPQAESLYGQDEQEASIDLAGQIMEAYYQAEQEAIENEVKAGLLESGVAGAAAKSIIDNARKDMRKEITDFRKATKESYEDKLADAEKQIQTILDANKSLAYSVKNLEQKNEALTKKMAEEVVKAKARTKTRELKTYIEAEETKKQKKEIDKIAVDLLNRAMNPTDKKYMPEGMRKPIAEFLTGIDFVSHKARLDSKNTAKWTDRMNQLRSFLVSAQQGNEPEAIGVVLDPDLIDDMEQFTQRNSEVAKVSQLPSWDLKELHSILSRLRTAVNKANETFVNERYKNQTELNKAINRDIHELGTRKYSYQFMNKMRDFFSKSLEDPVTYFETLGSNAKTLFDAFIKGFDVRARHIKQYTEFMKELQKNKEAFYKWEKNTHTFHLHTGDVTLTDVQIMSLYELMKRPQARNHIVKRGFVPEVFTMRGKDVVQNESNRMSPEEFRQITSVLSQQQIEVADAIQQFMAKECAKWGNHTSMELYGYKKFNEENYFPIRTVGEEHDTKDKDVGKNASLWANKNMSSSKELVIDAKNNIVLDNIFDVFANHVTDMATYDGMVLPQMDAMRWYNFREVFQGIEDGQEVGDVYGTKNELKRVMGVAGEKYFENFILGINGREPKARGLLAPQNLIGNYKRFAVMGKIRVAIQQPTAYVRALDEVNAKYLTKALITTNPIKYAKISQEKSMLSWWKAQGYYETMLGKNIKDMGVGKNPVAQFAEEAAGFSAQKMDDLTWGTLYHAIEYEIEDTTDLKPGTQAFDDAVVKRFEDVVTKTQVVDTMLHRTDIMRNQNEIVKLATSFRAEPLKSYNMLLRGMLKVVRNPRDKKNWAALFKALVVFALNGIAVSLAKSAWDALRYDDDITPKEVTFWKKWIGDGDFWSWLFDSNMGDDVNVINLIPFVDQAWEIITKKVRGEYYTNNNMMTQGIEKLGDTVVHLGKRFTEEDQSKVNQTDAGLVMETLQAVSMLTGQPAYNILNDAMAIYNANFDNIDLKKTQYSDLQNAIMYGNNIDETVQKLINQGKTADGIKDSITNKWKTVYQGTSGENKQLLKTRITQALTQAGVPANKIQEMFDKWDGKVTESGSTSEYQGIYNSIDRGGNIQESVQKMISSGKKPGDVKRTITMKYKDQLLKSKSANLRNNLVKAYMAAGDTNEQANERINDWFK